MKSETFIFPVMFEYLLSTSSTICYLVPVHVSGQTSAQSCIFKFKGSAQYSCRCVLSSGWGVAHLQPAWTTMSFIPRPSFEIVVDTLIIGRKAGG